MRLLVVQICQHPRTQLVEHAQFWIGNGVGGLEEPLALGVNHGGEERPLVGEVVVHQRARHPGPLGDLVDANLVVRALAEHFGAEREQFVAPILGGQSPSRFRHHTILLTHVQQRRKLPSGIGIAGFVALCRWVFQRVIGSDRRGRNEQWT